MARKITIKIKLPAMRSPKLPTTIRDFGEFLVFLRSYTRRRFYGWFARFEVLKDIVVDLLYQKRGRYVRPFLHFGTIGLIFFVILVGPVIFSGDKDEFSGQVSRGVLSANAYSVGFTTQRAEEVRQFRGGEIMIHTVQDGETLSEIAERYGLKVETILWENDLTATAAIKPGKELRILPVDGVRHKVAKGETIFTIAKRYGLDNSQAQVIVDYPFNEFLDDETFALAVGQYIMVPNGVPPKKVQPISPGSGKTVANLRNTPDAGTVSPFGNFIWPAQGIITQNYSFYHKAIDIANRAAGPILAADSGTVTVAGWPDSSGYGNRVMIDHGNGYVTLYAHMSVVQVVPGQRVNRGDVLGQMGSTGRSTGTHLHFEIRQGGAVYDPLGYL